MNLIIMDIIFFLLVLVNVVAVFTFGSSLFLKVVVVVTETWYADGFDVGCASAWGEVFFRREGFEVGVWEWWWHFVVVWVGVEFGEVVVVNSDAFVVSQVVIIESMIVTCGVSRL